MNVQILATFKIFYECGLQGIKAREILHSAMERIIEEKLKKQQASDYCDAFDYMLSSAKENDYDLTMQELKVKPSRPNPKILCAVLDYIHPCEKEVC